MSLEVKVQKFIAEQQLVEKGDRLLIACSGGIDSMGLVHFFIQYKHILKIKLFVAHVDHMLRGETSAEDRRFVENFCNQQDIPYFSTAIPIPQLLEKEGGNSQALCRRERYAFFADVMQKHHINKLVTAHHADDQLESILMALTRAGTITGMKGMYPKREFSYGTLIRPFLMVTKEEIREYLEGKGGAFREDASNAKDDYTRNRFRHHIVPLLKNENPNVSSHALQFTKELQQDDGFLNELAMKRFPYVVKKNHEDSYTLEITLFQNEPVALQRRIILILLNYLYNNSNITQGCALTSSIMDLCKSIEGSATIHLPEQFIANRKYGEIVFEKQRESIEETLSIHQVSVNEWTLLQNGIRLYIGEASNVVNNEQNKIYYLSSKNFAPPFFVRTRKDGDRISLKGMTEQKRLSRLFIDEKIPLSERDTWPIVVDANDEVIAVLGVRVNKNLSRTKRLADDLIMIIELENLTI